MIVEGVILVPGINDQPPKIAIISPSRGRDDNDSRALLIINGGQLVKHNTWKDHVITIIIIWMGIHYDIG